MAEKQQGIVGTVRSAFEDRPFATVMTLAAAARLVAVAAGGGFVIADEVFQYLEPAFRQVHGYGELPWEFVLGARSWLLTGIYAILMHLIEGVGVRDPLVIAGVLHVLNAACSLLLVAGVYRLAERLYGTRTAVWAGLLAAFSVSLLYYSSRTLSDNASAICVPWAFYFAVRGARDEAGTGWQYFRAGLVVGLATMIRYPSAIFFVAIGAYLLFTGKVTGLIRLTAGFVFTMLLQGVLDLVTWGHFLHSAVVFVHYNFIEGRNAIHGVEPWHFYFVRFWNAYWYLTWLAAPLVLIGMWRSWVVNYGNVVYLAAISLVAHKEVRFLLPVLPLLIVGMAVGFEMVFGRMRYPRLRRAGPYVMALLVAVPLVWWIPHNWRPGINICTAMRDVGRQGDATGLIVFFSKHGGGGYFYLRKNIPVAYQPSPIVFTDALPPEHEIGIEEALASPRFNYAIINAELPEHRVRVAARGFALWKTIGSREIYRRAGPPSR